MAEEEKKTKKKPTNRPVKKPAAKATKGVKAPTKKTTPKTVAKEPVKKVIPKVEPKKEVKVEEPKVEVKKVEVREEPIKKEEPIKQEKKTTKKATFGLTKREKFLIGLVILTIVVTGIMYYVMFGAKYYQYKASWGIHLPESLEEVYSVKSKKDEFGDYNTYHIFKYENEDDVKKIVNWTAMDSETIQYKSYKEAANEWLNVLGVEEQNRPTFINVEYWYKNDAKSDEIIMIKDSKNKKIYLLEYFLKDE